MSTGQQLSVAILEDHPLMRNALATVLEEAGFQVVGSYADPEGFLASVPQNPPQVAIIDISLQNASGAPREDGLGVLEQLQRRHPDLRALIYSASLDPGLVERCYSRGAAGYLDKVSAGNAELVHAVQAVARGERQFPVDLLASPFSPPPAAPFSPELASLSPREKEVLTYVAAGADNLKIGAILQISERTVKAHLSSLYRKLNAENRTQLALTALQLGVKPANA